MGCISALCVWVCVFVEGPRVCRMPQSNSDTLVYMYMLQNMGQMKNSRFSCVKWCKWIDSVGGGFCINLCLHVCMCVQFQAIFQTCCCSFTGHHQQLEWKSSRIFQINLAVGTHGGELTPHALNRFLPTTILISSLRTHLAWKQAKESNQPEPWVCQEWPLCHRDDDD